MKKELDINKVAAYREKIAKEATSTERMDKITAVLNLRALLNNLGYAGVEILAADGPLQAHELVEKKFGQVPEDFTDCWFGAISNYWVKTVRYAEENHGFEVPKEIREKLDLYEKVCDSLFCFFGWEGVFVAIDRPTTLTFDDNNELHNETGPSCAFADGFAIYSYHGVAVTKEIIESPEKITVEAIEREENAEVRRIMIDRMGVEKYLNAIKAEVIEVDTVPVIQGESAITMRALLKDKEGRKFLCGTDGSTKRVYYMQVPKECNTCREAGTALAGFDENSIIAVS